MVRLVLSSVFACVVWIGSGAALAEDLVVFATSSTVGAMTEAAEKFTTQIRVPVTIEVSSPGLLSRRIEDGEMPHLIVLDGKTWMDQLAARKLIVPATRRTIFTNRLVLIVHRDFPHALLIAPELPLRALLGGSKFAIADPAVDPAGELARAALKSIDVLRQMEERFERAPDVRAALALVDRGDVEAGIVYATDARISHEVVISGVFLRTMHPPVVYEIAVTAAKASDPARKLHAFLVSQAARDIYANHGFLAE